MRKMEEPVEDRALLLSSVSQDCKLVNAALLAEVFAGRPIGLYKKLKEPSHRAEICAARFLCFLCCPNNVL